MITIETNLLVRFLVWDDPEQAEKACRLIESNTV
jgi:predicted nucleic-acid-binding protein